MVVRCRSKRDGRMASLLKILRQITHCGISRLFLLMTVNPYLKQLFEYFLFLAHLAIKLVE